MNFFSVVSLLAIALSAVNALTVNTPTGVVQCQPLLITWDATGGTPPFFLSVVPGASPSSAALFSWSGLTGTSFSWTAVPVASGTSLVINLRDSSGLLVQTAPFTVQPGTDSTCLTSSVGSSPAPSSLGTSSPLSSVNSTISTSTSTTSTLRPTTTTPTVTRPPSTSTPSSIRPSSTTTPGSTAAGNTGGALSNVVNFGSAGLLAILIGAVLA